VTPVVFILSDSGGGNAAERGLFPVELRSDLRIVSIRFNPVSTTAMVKALLRVVTEVQAAVVKRRVGGGRGGGGGMKGVGSGGQDIITQSQVCMNLHVIYYIFFTFHLSVKSFF